MKIVEHMYMLFLQLGAAASLMLLWNACLTRSCVCVRTRIPPTTSTYRDATVVKLPILGAIGTRRCVSAGEGVQGSGMNTTVNKEVVVFSWQPTVKDVGEQNNPQDHLNVERLWVQLPLPFSPGWTSCSGHRVWWPLRRHDDLPALRLQAM